MSNEISVYTQQVAEIPNRDPFEQSFNAGTNSHLNERMRQIFQKVSLQIQFGDLQRDPVQWEEFKRAVTGKYAQAKVDLNKQIESSSIAADRTSLDPIRMQQTVKKLFAQGDAYMNQVPEDVS